MEKTRYKTFDEFREIFERIASLERTCLSLSDYLMFVRQRGYEIIQPRILLNEANSPFINDLFDVEGKLKEVGDTLENADEWNIKTVYLAYRGGRKGPHFDYESGILTSTEYSKEETTKYVRDSLHKLDDLIKEGCNLLFSHSQTDAFVAFFSQAVPAQMMKQNNPYK